jgi:bacterioferritin-associated ferredoxin
MLLSNARGRHLCDGFHDIREHAVIVCSCNVLSDSQVRSTIVKANSCVRLKHVYASLCCTAKCGRCVRTIKAILEAGSVATEAANVS